MADLNLDFEQLSSLVKQKAKFEIEATRQKELARISLKDAMALLKEIRTLDSELAQKKKSSLSSSYAAATRNLLKDFASQIASNKLDQLQKEFARSFQKLTRKSDLLISLTITPNTLQVSLLNENNTLIQRDKLSAGERQIYAIALLEALGRTTGHSLPIIIDTPLGRLDTHHRSKIVENYLPYASQQVIVLSTDSEIDETYFKELEPFVSKSYQITYEPRSRSSHIKHGYFWDIQNKEAP